MTSEEKTILTKTVKRVNYYLQKRYDKYSILKYIDYVIESTRVIYSDELLRALFNLRQQFLLGKEVK